MRLFDCNSDPAEQLPTAAPSAAATIAASTKSHSSTARCEGIPGEETLVTLRGRRLLAPNGIVIAELDAADIWRTPTGLLCEALTIPAARATAYVSPNEIKRAAREADQLWLAAAVAKIALLCERYPEITADDLWEHMEHPPRESRLVGNAFKRAEAQCLIESTGRHQRSRRAMNHKRPVLIWRSLDPAQA